MDDRPLEKTIEAALVRRVKALGGTCEKFTSPSRRSVPDRLVVLPSDHWQTVYPGSPADVLGFLGFPVICFVETKRPGEQPTKKQHHDHEKRRALGVRVYVVDTMEAARAFPY